MEECCGMHAVCERDLQRADDPIIYYDDEELDVYRGRAAEDYTDDDVEAFAEVLHTMWESDVAGWINSLQRRGIELPIPLRDEVIMLINP